MLFIGRMQKDGSVLVYGGVPAVGDYVEIPGIGVFTVKVLEKPEVSDNAEFDFLYLNVVPHRRTPISL